jgi:citrate lyase beta subunit
LGGDGKWAIHPDQILTINKVFTPSADEIASARAIIEAFDNSSGAVNFNGLMIDEASKKVAMRLLERATQTHK